MNARQLSVFAAFILFAVFAAASCCTAKSNAKDGTAQAVSGASKKADAKAVEGQFTFRGRVVMMGNEPHTYVGIRTEDETKTYAVYPEATAREMSGLQGHLIEFVAVPTDKSAGEASLYLKDGTIRLVSWKIVD